MKRNKIVGISFIAFALVILFANIGLLPSGRLLAVVITFIGASIAIHGLVNRNFFEMLFPLAIIAWLYRSELNIEKISLFVLMLVAAFLAVGLQMLFGKKASVQIIKQGNVNRAVGISENERGGIMNINLSDENGKKVVMDDVTVGDSKDDEEESKFEMTSEDGRFTISDNFGACNHYFSDENFREARISDNCGSTNVYFSDVVAAAPNASIFITDNMGRVNVFLPSGWDVRINQSDCIGPIKLIDNDSQDVQKKDIVTAKISDNIGSVKIYIGQ